jgi:hypothetical protein
VKAPTPLVIVLFLAAGCYEKSEHKGGPMSSTGLASPDAEAADAAADAAAPDDAALDAPDDAGDAAAPADAAPDGLAPDGAADVAASDGARDVAAPADAQPDGTAPDGATMADRAGEGPPASPVAAYRQHLDELWEAWSARWVACFNSAAEVLTPDVSPFYDETPEQHAYSLEHGLLALDDAAARACLEAVRGSACEDLAAETYRASCGKSLVGKVATGGFCLSAEDCGASTESCQMTEMDACAYHCAPVSRAALGELCLDRPCVDGTYCAAAVLTTDSRCQVPEVDGASCQDRTACAAGTFCQPAAAGSDPGTCRPVRAGVACLGSWQCPLAYACLIPAGSSAGTCQPGRKKGEACTFHGKEEAGGPYHDCASGLFCYPNASNQYTCGAGHELGEGCADFDVGAPIPISVNCRVGSCQLSAGKLTCVADRKLGEACTPDLPCASDLVCTGGKCVDPVVRVGERCTTDDNERCPDGARCAYPTPAANTGTCVLIKKAGETCTTAEDCAMGTSCTGGVCTACK